MLLLLLLACPAVKIADSAPGPGPEDSDTVPADCDTPLTWYADADGDRFGDPATTTTACALPSGYTDDNTDCDDSSAAASPGGTEICDGLDNDCDGATDDDRALGAPLWYADADADGYGDPGASVAACAAPGGYVDNADDCDDTDGDVSPDGVEVCDGADQDCDGTADEDAADAPAWFIDYDDDGYGSPAWVVYDCDAPPGYAATADDCDDTSPAVYPGEEERCDGVDNDCDGTVDQGAEDMALWYADADADGFGDPLSTLLACELPDGYTTDATDCDDSSAAIYPEAADLCDDLDNDCDGSTDEDGTQTFYRDRDGDSYGDPSTTATGCAAPAGFVSDGGDCDDADGGVSPGAPEVCDGADQDCDGLSDEDAVDGDPWYMDSDGDGYGGWSSISACTQPDGYVAAPDDCDDSAATVYPGAPEVCDGADQDCDGLADEDAADPALWFADNDGDGFGSSETVSACAQPPGFVSNNADCDDGATATYPGAAEVCDGLDQDCDGTADNDAIDPTTWYLDSDGDGAGSLTAGLAACSQPPGFVSNAADCDDTRSDISPYGVEVCDGLDQDCDGTADEDPRDGTTWYADADADSYGDPAAPLVACTPTPGYVSDATDCDDTSAQIQPGSAELCDGVDQDCDGVADDNALDAAFWFRDGDSDGYGDPTTGVFSCDPGAGYVSDGTDCDDANAALSPTTVWYIDQDSDGYGQVSTSVTSCTQPAGFVLNNSDCYDLSRSIYPGAPEVCDTSDNDCNGSVDDGAVDAATWYRDADSDGYGGPDSTMVACSAPTGYAADASDCDDSRSDVSPGQSEVCDDGVDNDCDGTYEECRFRSTLSASAQINGAASGDAINALAGLGDWNGDGKAEFAIGAPSADPAGSNSGSVYFLSGPVSGTVDLVDIAARIDGIDGGGGFGYRVTSMGDLNYDGLREVAISAPTIDAGGTRLSGVVAVFPGSSSLPSGTLSDASMVIQGVEASGYLGLELAAAGDADGDGSGDLLIGARGVVDSTVGEAWVVTATTSGVQYVTDLGWRLSNESADGLGDTLAGPGDVNGDGVDDVVVGTTWVDRASEPEDDAYGTDSSVNNGGAVWVLYGPITSDLMPATDYDVAIYGSATFRLFGQDATGAEDTNSDGYADLYVSAIHDSACGVNTGAVYLFESLTAGAELRQYDASATRCGPMDEARAWVLGAQADLDLDGTPDLVVGAPGYGGSQYGSIHVAYGPLSGTASLSASDAWVQGAESYDQLGSSIGTVGDLDGNGMTDIAAAAPGVNGGYSNRGSVYLFSGSGL